MDDLERLLRDDEAEDRAVVAGSPEYAALRSRDAARRERVAAVLSEGQATLAQVGFAVDYLEARNADTLMPVQSAKEGPLRLLVAARLGKTRLIDNIAV